MIIVAIVALSAVVLTALYATMVGLPQLPAVVVTSAQVLIDAVVQGTNIVKYIIGNTLVNAMLRITLAYESVKLGYKFVMWIAKKIPMFGVSD